MNYPGAGITKNYLFPARKVGELNHFFSSAIAERTVPSASLMLALKLKRKHMAADGRRIKKLNNVIWIKQENFSL